MSPCPRNNMPLEQSGFEITEVEVLPLRVDLCALLSLLVHGGPAMLRRPDNELRMPTFGRFPVFAAC